MTDIVTYGQTDFRGTYAFKNYTTCSLSVIYTGRLLLKEISEVAQSQHRDAIAPTLTIGK